MTGCDIHLCDVGGAVVFGAPKEGRRSPPGLARYVERKVAIIRASAKNSCGVSAIACSTFLARSVKVHAD